MLQKQSRVNQPTLLAASTLYQIHQTSRQPTATIMSISLQKLKHFLRC